MAHFNTRPVVMGTRGVVTAGHYLAAAAGFRMMEAGGNAIDAAASMSICLNLLEPQSCGIAGEVPVLVYWAPEKKVYAISGVGWAPEAFSIDWCRENGIDLIPGDGYLPATVPAPVDTWALALARFGTFSMSQILQPAIELAENGFPVYPGLEQAIAPNLDKYTQLYPTTGKVYCPQGVAPRTGEIFRNPDFAEMLRIMCRAEDAASGKGRIAGIEAARHAFYEGPIADKMIAFMEDNPVEDASGVAHKGLMTHQDLAEWHAEVDEPVGYNYRGLDVWKCSSWTQGPVYLQQLAILEGFDLGRMEHNSTEYLHTLMETAKLAFADREAYYGDPKFDDLPMEILLSEAYNAGRHELISDRASTEMRPGDIGNGVPEYATIGVGDDNRAALGIGARAVRDLGLGHAHMGDTTHLDAVDSQGNMVSATPSGGWIGTSPVVDGLGFPMGTRGQMFYLNSARPNALEPRKRPRATLTPSMATRNGDPYLAFGTPGGDSQDQWTLQFFLNYVDFKMDIQQALDAPTAHSVSFPSSFYPREAFPGRMIAESRLPADVIAGLKDRGHDVEMADGWAHGKVLGIRFDKETGVISGGASPRSGIGYAIGW